MLVEFAAIENQLFTVKPEYPCGIHSLPKAFNSSSVGHLLGQFGDAASAF